MKEIRGLMKNGCFQIMSAEWRRNSREHENENGRAGNSLTVPGNIL